MSPMKEEPQDNNGTVVNKDRCRDQALSSRELPTDKKRRLRSIALLDDSEDECIETSGSEKKAARKNKKSAEAKVNNARLEVEESDVRYDKRKPTVTDTIRKITSAQLDEKVGKTKPRKTMKLSRKLVE